MSSQRGQVLRVKSGWSCRWRDASGRRRQRGTFPLKSDAQKVLRAELDKVNLGALYKPELTLNELVAAFLDQYDAAPASVDWLSYYLWFAQDAFGDAKITTLDSHALAAWRRNMRGRKKDPHGHRKPASDHMKHAAVRALRQVLAAAVGWGWIEKNPATAFKNEAARPTRFVPFESWADIMSIAAELDPEWPDRPARIRHHASSGTLVITAAGTGLRPEELFGLDWSSVDLAARTLTVRRAFAKGVMKEYTKTTGSERVVPLRGIVVDALERFHDAFPGSGLVFQSERGGPVNLGNWRQREWNPAQDTAGITPRRRPYDLRHTYASWSLAAGVNPFQVARRMGTSLQMIQATYGHLLVDADAAERDTLDKYDREPA